MVISIYNLKSQRLISRLNRVILIHLEFTKLIYLNFQPLEVVSRYRDSQPQVVENYSYAFENKHLQILMFKQSFYSQ